MTGDLKRIRVPRCRYEIGKSAYRSGKGIQNRNVRSVPTLLARESATRPSRQSGNRPPAGLASGPPSQPHSGATQTARRPTTRTLPLSEASTRTPRRRRTLAGGGLSLLQDAAQQNAEQNGLFGNRQQNADLFGRLFRQQTPNRRRCCSAPLLPSLVGGPCMLPMSRVRNS